MLQTIRRIMRWAFALAIIGMIAGLGFMTWTAYGTGQVILAGTAGAGVAGWLLAAVFWMDYQARHWLESKGMNPDEV